MKVKDLLFLALGGAMLTACSPHPGAGTWKATSDNAFGIVDLSLQFDGKAEFATSSDPERRELYEFVVQDEKRGELFYNGESVATFERQPHQ